MYFCCDKNAEAPHTTYIFQLNSVEVFIFQLLLFPTLQQMSWMVLRDFIVKTYLLFY